MWLALVLLGLLQARRHGLLSFLISSAWSCPPDWWLPHAHSMSKTDWLLHSCRISLTHQRWYSPLSCFQLAERHLSYSIPHLCLGAAWSIGLYHEKSPVGPNEGCECLWMCWNLKNAALEGRRQRYEGTRTHLSPVFVYHVYEAVLFKHRCNTMTRNKSLI